MKVHRHWQPVLLAAIVLTGCPSTPPPGGVRVKTFPVTGIVHVDGEPTKGVSIGFYPQTNVAVKFQSSATTDASGKFSPMTYVAGDGLPEGTYKLIFIKDESEPSPMGMLGDAEFKDGLKGLYAVLGKSTHEFTVTKGGKNDFGVIELSTNIPGK